MRSVAEPVGAAIALGAGEDATLSRAELSLLGSSEPEKPAAQITVKLRRRIRDGEDPLGNAFCALFAPADRPPNVATYTPILH
jgi:adenine-specific DNA-methyltransferase